jgi:hypothetical protein
MSIKIDKNIPIPIRSKHTALSELVEKMQPNDSIFVTDRREMQTARNLLLYRGFKPLSRKEGKGWRIWKLEYKTA